MAQREGLEFAGAIHETGRAHRLVAAMTAAGEIHALRDPTGGGLAATLVEIAAAARIGVEAEARAIPVKEPVPAACELLGIDPLFVANEGEAGGVRGPAQRRERAGGYASLAGGRRGGGDRRGGGSASGAGAATDRQIGGTRVVDLPFGEQLPRIC